MTIRQLNALGRSGFVDALGGTFEESPWVAERAFELRPFDGLEAIHSAMAGVVARATREEQIALLRAHPDLGSRARMSDASAGEQAGAGLDRLSPVEFTELQRLNGAYRERFGFPFILAVKGSSARQILDALRTRIAHGVDEEFAEALGQVGRIAWFRLEKTLSR